MEHTNKAYSIKMITFHSKWAIINNKTGVAHSFWATRNEAYNAMRVLNWN